MTKSLFLSEFVELPPLARYVSDGVKSRRIFIQRK